MSGIFLSDLKYQVVEPALASINLNTVAALNLVTGTALAESNAGASGLVQHPGPALGIFQMEPATEHDIWTNFLEYNPTMQGAVLAMLALGATTPQLVTNLRYAAAMCRIKYWRSPLLLPAYNDASALCGMWKNAYNTSLGAGDVDAAHVTFFQAAIDA